MKKEHKKRTIKIFETRLDEANKNPKIKSIIHFDEANSNCIKLIAVEKITLARQ